MKIKDMKKGEYFTKKPIEAPKESQVWVRGAYDISHRQYECTRFDDISVSCYIRGDKDVFTDFTF